MGLTSSRSTAASRLLIPRLSGAGPKSWWVHAPGAPPTRAVQGETKGMEAWPAAGAAQFRTLTWVVGGAADMT